MISLSAEMADTKGRHAERGWICFDRDCTLCTSLARRFRRTFEKRGFGLAAFQDPRVAALLALSPDQLLRETRVITTEGEIHGGAEASVYLAKQVWWAWPFFAAAQIPGVLRILGIGYRWIADHRPCSSGACTVARKKVAG
jgi:predicted DCC family thiol-disulfide oxidoreductase YuxK